MDIALLTPAKGGDSRPEPRHGTPGQSGSSSPFAAEYHKARHSGNAPQEASRSAGQGAAASAVSAAPSGKSRPASTDDPAHAAEAPETMQSDVQTVTLADGAAPLVDAATLPAGVAVGEADPEEAARTARDAAAFPDTAPALALDPLARDIAQANGEILLGGESVDFSGIWQQTARLEMKKDDQDTLAAPMSLNLALADVRERLAAIQQAGQAPTPTSGERAPAVAGSMPGLQALLAEQATPATQPTSQAGEGQAFDATTAKLQSATPPAGDATLQGTALSKADRAGLEALATNAGISGAESGSPASGPHLAAGVSQAPGAQAQPTVGAGTAPVATATLNTPVASSEWGAALSQQLVRIQQRGDQRVELHLNPTELGPLSVSLKLGEQQAQLHFSSAHASVRAAVEAAIPQLREALADSGISLGEAMVSDQGQFSQNPFSQERSGQQAGTGRPGLVDDGLADIGESIAGSAGTRDLDVSGAINLYA